MRVLRSFVLISTLVGSLVLAAPAAFAAGRAPAGNGLSPLTGQQDITITDLVCDDGTTEVLVARGGLTAWVAGDPDRMYVLTSISGAGTVTTPSGSMPYAFEQSYGKKSGLGEPTACSMNYTIVYGDVLDAGIMEVTLVRIW